MQSELKYYAIGPEDVAQLHLVCIQLGLDSQQCLKPGMVAHTHDLNTWNLEAGKVTLGHPLQHTEFKDGLNCV